MIYKSSGCFWVSKLVNNIWISSSINIPSYIKLHMEQIKKKKVRKLIASEALGK